MKKKVKPAVPEVPEIISEEPVAADEESQFRDTVRSIMTSDSMDFDDLEEAFFHMTERDYPDPEETKDPIGTNEENADIPVGQDENQSEKPSGDDAADKAQSPAKLSKKSIFGKRKRRKSEPAEPEPEKVSGSTEEPEPEVISEPAAEPEPEMIPEPTAEPEPEKIPEPTAEPEPEVIPEPTAEPEPEMIPEPTEEPKPEMISEPAAEPEPEMIPEPTEEPEPEKISEPVEADSESETVKLEESDSESETVKLPERQQEEKPSASGKKTRKARKNGSLNRYDLLEEEKKNQSAKEKAKDPLSILAGSRPMEKIIVDEEKQKALKRRKMIPVILAILAGAALLGILIFALLSREHYGSVYLTNDGELFVREKNGREEKIASDVEDYLLGNLSKKTYIYRNKAGQLIYSCKGRENIVDSDVSLFDVHVSPDLKNIVYVKSDDINLTSDVFLWNCEADTIVQLEYVVSYAEHFRFSDDSRFLFYNIQSISDNHMIKSVDLKSAAGWNPESGKNNFTGVFYVNYNYLITYDVTGTNDALLFYDCEQDRLKRMTVKDNKEEVILNSLSDVKVLEKDDVVITLGTDGSCRVRGYGGKKITELDVKAGDTKFFEKIELIEDAAGNPEFLGLSAGNGNQGYYAVSIDELKKKLNRKGTESIQAQKIGESNEVYQVKAADGRICFLSNHEIAVTEPLNAGKSATDKLPEIKTVAPGYDINRYLLNESGTVFWFDSLYNLHSCSCDKVGSGENETVFSHAGIVGISTPDSTQAGNTKRSGKCSEDVFVKDLDHNMYIIQKNGSEPQLIHENVDEIF